MKSHIHEVVRRLLELHTLEERLAVLRHDPAEAAKTQAQIESVRADLPMNVLMVHDQMRARGRRSVSEIRRGVCSGCHLALGIGNVAAVRAGELRQCGHCARYVYVVEEEQTATQSTVPACTKAQSRARSVAKARQTDGSCK
jgi:predicted  nucleic acid-binding Zn-ribbon protein